MSTTTKSRNELLDELFAQEISIIIDNPRILSMLHASSIYFVGQVARQSEDELLRIRGLGVSALGEIKSGLLSQHLSLETVIPLGTLEKQRLRDVKIERALCRSIFTVFDRYEFMEMLRIFHRAKIFLLRKFLEPEGKENFKAALLGHIESKAIQGSGRIGASRRNIVRHEFKIVLDHFEKYVLA